MVVNSATEAMKTANALLIIHKAISPFTCLSIMEHSYVYAFLTQAFKNNSQDLARRWTLFI
jgi:hypothetical protein